MAEIDERLSVCRRHGISEALAPMLHGSTPPEWEADAAVRASVARMLGGRLDAPPPEDKPLNPEQIAAESREAADKAFLEALFAPKRGEAERLQSLGLIDAPPEDES